jgi:hypothetical protein
MVAQASTKSCSDWGKVLAK